MFKVMLVGVDLKTRQVFHQILSAKGSSELVHVEYGKELLKAIEPQNVSLLVIAEDLPDQNSIDLVKKVISKDPFQNIALVSDQTPAQFHEITEGLGVLGQITKQDRLKAITTILDKVEQISYPANS